MMRSFKVILFLLLSFPCFGAYEPKEAMRRIHAHLLLSDNFSACREATYALNQFPDSKEIHEMAIRSLGYLGDVETMMKVWDNYLKKFGLEKTNQDLLEDMCFSMLRKGQKSSGSSPQQISLIGAALTADMRAVPFLLQGMRHTNAVIRALAAKLSSVYGDAILKEELVRLFREENIEEVRLEVIETIGSLKIESLYPELLSLISHPKTKAREKKSAIQAIVQMRDHVDENELTKLLKSPRSGLRLVGCEVLYTCELKEYLHLVYPLLKDAHPDVQAAALRVIGHLGGEVRDEIKKLALHAHDPLVGVTAAWVCLISSKGEEKELMSQWLYHEDVNVSRLASGAVANSGRFGTLLAREGIERISDLYVQANLAIGLAGQREECEKACQILANFLRTNEECCMWQEEGNFKILQKSSHRHSPAIENYPMVVDQTVRLEILNLLAILEYPEAQDSIKEFLKKGHYGVTGLAAETLLGEGDQTAIEIVRELLSDKNKDIRYESALVLATWGKDAQAIPILLDMYGTADRDLKIKILEAIGRIGDKKTVPFLLERLQEPSLVLRMISACILVRTLNH